MTIIDCGNRFMVSCISNLHLFFSGFFDQHPTLFVISIEFFLYPLIDQGFAFAVYSSSLLLTISKRTLLELDVGSPLCRSHGTRRNYIVRCETSRFLFFSEWHLWLPRGCEGHQVDGRAPL